MIKIFLLVATVLAEPSFASECSDLMVIRNNVASKIEALKHQQNQGSANVEATLRSDLRRLVQAGRNHSCGSNIVAQSTDAFEIQYTESAIKSDTFNLKRSGVPVSWVRVFKTGSSQITNL